MWTDGHSGYNNSHPPPPILLRGGGYKYQARVLHAAWKGNTHLLSQVRLISYCWIPVASVLSAKRAASDSSLIFRERVAKSWQHAKKQNIQNVLISFCISTSLWPWKKQITLQTRQLKIILTTAIYLHVQKPNNLQIVLLFVIAFCCILTHSVPRNEGLIPRSSAHAAHRTRTSFCKLYCRCLEKHSQTETGFKINFPLMKGVPIALFQHSNQRKYNG